MLYYIDALNIATLSLLSKHLGFRATKSNMSFLRYYNAHVSQQQNSAMQATTLCDLFAAGCSASRVAVRLPMQVRDARTHPTSNGAELLRCQRRHSTTLHKLRIVLSIEIHARMR